MRSVSCLFLACIVFMLPACDTPVDDTGDQLDTEIESGLPIDRNLVGPASPSPRIPAIPIADLTESVGTINVTIDGNAFALETLTVTPPAGLAPFPLAVISHGNPRDGTARGNLRIRHLQPVAEDFARRGYKAIVFARRGFAGSTGVYVEGYGDCNVLTVNDGYAAAGRTAAKDFAAVIAQARTMPDVDGSRVIAAGQSGGGFAVSALAASPPAGLIGIVNFAGGRGSTRDFTNCSERMLTAAFGDFGRGARVPTLWLYSTADRYFWPALVENHFRAYIEDGAPVRWVRPGALWYHDDGHRLVELGGREFWRPAIDAFLLDIGAPTWEADPGDGPVARLPAPGGLSDQGRKDWLLYLGYATHKAFATAPTGEHGYATRRRSLAAARAAALANCSKGGTVVGCMTVSENHSP